MGSCPTRAMSYSRIVKNADADTYYYLKNKPLFTLDRGVPSQMVLTSTLKREGSRMQVHKNILQQVLVKSGAWIWAFSPLLLPPDRAVMVVGLEARRATTVGSSIQAAAPATAT